MATIDELNSTIFDLSLEIENQRILRSKLLEQRARTVFENAGMRDGDQIYKGDTAYSFDLENSTVSMDCKNQLWASIYGRRTGRKAVMVGHCAQSDIGQYFFPEEMR